MEEIKQVEFAGGFLAGSVRQQTIGVHTVYHPIIDHDEGTVFGYEALSRPYDQNGHISPEIWFKEATKANRHVEADLLAASSATANGHFLQDSLSETMLFINVLPISILEGRYRQGLEELHRMYSHRQKVVLELVEYVEYDPLKLKSAVQALRTLGYGIALDDIGQGVSTLRAIVDLEPDFIKLDRSLVQGCGYSKPRQRLISHLTSFMGTNGKVIAEGIEDPKDLMAVMDAGVKLSQGYFWVRPNQLTPEFTLETSSRIDEFVLSRQSGRLKSSSSVVGPKVTIASLRNSLGRLLHWNRHHEVTQHISSTVSQAAENGKEKTSIVNGQVSIVNGQVVVTDPNEYGMFATLEIPDDPRLMVTVDGHRVSGKVVLSKSHNIKVDVINTEPSVSYVCTPTMDQMAVVICADVKKGSRLKLRDSEAKDRLQLELEETSVLPNGNIEDILDLLTSYGFKGRIDFDALRRLSLATDTLEETVLRGRPPTAEQPDRYEIRRTLVSRDPATKKLCLANVRAGTILATFSAGHPGKPGENVFGNWVSASYPIKKLTFGSGVLEINGQHIVAARDGVPLLTKEVIDVIPEHVFDRHVTSKNGVIRVDGNVVVHGGVLNGHIQAIGSVTIYGNVERSTIVSERGITVYGDVMESNLWAGKTQILQQEITALVEGIVYELEQFNQEYSVILSYAIKRFDALTVVPKIPSLLLEKRHRTLHNHLQSFVSHGSKFPNITHHAIAEWIRTKWMSTLDQLRQVDFENLETQLRRYLNEMKCFPSPKAFIRASCATSSSLQANGNIIITGGGSFTSAIESGNTVSVRGAVRGGFLIAKKSAYIGELGSPYITESSVRVTDAHGFIKVQLCHPNTLVEVGGKRNHLYTTERDIYLQGDTVHANNTNR